MIQLLNGDCLELMQSIPDKSVDMVMCDLPYGTTACKWDVVIPFEPLWTQYHRLVKEHGAIVLTASQPFTSALVMSNPEWFRHSWVWHKSKAANFPQVKRHPLKTHEDVVVFGSSSSSYYPQMVKGKLRTKGGYWTAGEAAVSNGTPSKVNDSYYPKSVIDISNADNFDAGLHPTQKPVALMEYLIKTYTKPGEVVLDNTMGSGTTGVACVNTGRSFIGIERDEGYFKIAQDRINAAMPIPEWLK